MDTSINELQKSISSVAKALTDCNLKFTDITAVLGSSFTLFKVKPIPGAKVSAFRKMEEEISLGLGTQIRIVTMPESIGIEVPRKNRTPVLLHDCIGNETWSKEQESSLPIILGEDVYKRLHIVDLATLPHLLVAGATKQGKTVFLRNLIMSLIWKKNPEDLKFVLIDPKGTELPPFETLKNKYIATLPESNSEAKGGCIATDVFRAEKMLSALCLELEKRYELLSSAGVRDIKSYNTKLKDSHLPYIVCICDEYADLIMGTDKARKNSIQSSIIRLAQKGRAVGIHIVISTQRPCYSVISGVIKANFPARAAFRVASRVDSSVILDCPGAEKLSGNGDMLFSCGMDCERLQAPMIEKEEMDKAIADAASPDDTLGSGTPYYLPEVVCGENENMSNEPLCPDEPLYDAAMSLVVMTQSCSQTMLQRKLGIGFVRAGRLVDLLIEKGVVVGKAGAYTVRKKSLESVD